MSRAHSILRRVSLHAIAAAAGALAVALVMFSSDYARRRPQLMGSALCTAPARTWRPLPAEYAAVFGVGGGIGGWHTAITVRKDYSCEYLTRSSAGLWDRARFTLKEQEWGDMQGILGAAGFWNFGDSYDANVCDGNDGILRVSVGGRSKDVFFRGVSPPQMAIIFRQLTDIFKAHKEDIDGSREQVSADTALAELRRLGMGNDGGTSRPAD